MLVSLVLTGLAVAQAANGTISGTVVDPQNKAVPGAAVKVTSTSLGAIRAAQTGADGKFVVAGLAPGGYSLVASAPGLRQPRPLTLTVGVGSSVQVELKLALRAAGQQVTVNARGPSSEGQTLAPAINKQAASTGNAIAGLTVTYLPNRDRDFTQFGALAAGADLNQGKLVVVGQRADATAVAVDGASFNDPLEGGRRGGADGGFFFPQTVVSEFDLVHDGAGAEVADTNGGFLNVATKEGSNRLHGEWFYIGRPGAWSGRDAFGHHLTDTQNEFGGSTGGPILPNKLFFYVGAEQDFLDQPVWTQFQAQSAGSLVPAALAAQQGETIGHNHPTALSLRLDAILGPHATLNLEGNFNRVRYTSVNPGSGQVFAAPSHLDSLSGQSLWYRFNLTNASGGAWVNQLQGQWAGDRRDLMPNSAAPEVAINGFGLLGGDGLAPHRFVSMQRELGESVSWNRHGQLLRWGADFAYDPAQELQQAFLQGRYDYNSLADFLAAAPRRFQQTFPTSPASLAYAGIGRRLGLFFSDRIPLSDTLTATAGLRWDGQWNPQPSRPNPAIPGTARVPNDLRQWQPRLGLAWNPRSSTVVRLSAGLYDAPTAATYFQRMFTDNGLNAVVADSVYDPQVLALAASGSGLAAPPAGLTTPAALAAGIADNFRNPRSWQTALSLQQELGRSFDFTSGFTHDSTWALERQLEANLLAPTIAPSGMPVFPLARPLPGVGQLLRTESSAHSSYNGWLNTFNYRGPYRLTLTANYTLAYARDDASQSGPLGRVSALNPFDLAAEAAPSNQDVRHNFNLSATDFFPLGLKVNPIFIARSGLPYTPIIGFDTQNDGNDLNDRALIGGRVAGRNSARQPALYDLDLRFVKDITLKGRGHHLDLFLDVFNALNLANRNFGPEAISQFGDAASPVFTAGLPLFSPGPGMLGSPRAIQFTARMVAF